MNDTTNTSPVSDAFGTTSEANLPPKTKAAVEKAKPVVSKTKAVKAMTKAPAKKAPAKKAPAKAKAPAKKSVKVVPKAKAKAKAAPKAPKSLVKRVGGDNKILFTFRIADTMLDDLTALATVHNMTPAALMRGALNAFLEQHGPKRRRG